MKRILIALASFASGLTIATASIQVTFPNGYSFCSPPLQVAAGSPLNDAEVLLPALQPGDAILTWNGGGFDYDTFLGPLMWFDITFNPIPVPKVPMGSGFVYLNASGAPEINVYPGFALGGAAGGGVRNLPLGYSLIGSFIPNPPYPLPPVPPPALPVLAGALFSVPADSPFLNLPLTPGDEILKWTGAGYVVSIYAGPSAWFDAITFNPINPPMIDPAEGFFYLNNSGAAEIWVQPP